jgi:hypothetical protein
VTPSFSATYPLSPDPVAGATSLAPSLIRTPRYSYLPLWVLQTATRGLAVLPKTTAVSGAAQRAVESTKPRASVAGSADADGTPKASSAIHAAAATVARRVYGSGDDIRSSPEHARPIGARNHAARPPNR